MKNRLTHDALIYRELLENNRLVDPTNGVEYFLTTLRGYFLEGSQNVFLYTGEFVTFISKFEILLRRLRASWEDTAPNYAQASPEYVQAIQEANQRRRAQHAEQVAQAQQMMAGQARGAAAPYHPRCSHPIQQILQCSINLLQDDRRSVHRLFLCQTTLLPCFSSSRAS